MVVVADGEQDGKFGFRIEGLLDGDAVHHFFWRAVAEFRRPVFCDGNTDVQIDVSQIRDEIRICFFRSQLRKQCVHF